MNKRKVLLIFVSILCLFAAKANSVQELQQQLKQAQTDTARARICGVLAYKLLFTDTTASLKYINEEIKWANSDPLFLAEAYRNHALLCIIQNKKEQGIQLYEQAITYAQQAKSYYFEASCLSLIAGFYQDMGDYDRSLHHYFKALKVAQVTPPDAALQKLIGSTYNNIASVYGLSGRDAADCISYYTKALGIATEQKNFGSAGLISANIAGEYLRVNKKDSAEISINNALAFAQKSGARDYAHAAVLTGAGEVFAQLNKPQKAEALLVEAVGLMDSLQRPINTLSSISALCHLYVKQNNLSAAEKYAHRLLQEAHYYGSKLYIRDGYGVLSKVAQEAKQYELALKHYQDYAAWNDSVFNETKDRNLAMVQSREEMLQHELEVRYQVKEKAHENYLLRVGVAVLLAFLFLFILLAVWIVRINKAKSVINKELVQKSELIEEQSKEKDFLLTEIHHRVKNNLQVVSSLLNLQANAVTDEAAKMALRESHNRVRSIALIHQKLYASQDFSSILMADYIVQLGAYLKTVYNTPSIAINVAVSPQQFKLNMNFAIPLGVILNELITNAIKHSPEDKSDFCITINFNQNSNGVCTLLFSDNGKGLPSDFNVATATSIGLRMVKELSRQLRGTINIRNDNGACFELVFTADDV